MFDADFVATILLLVIGLRKSVCNKLQVRNCTKRSTRAYYDSQWLKGQSRRGIYHLLEQQLLECPTQKHCPTALLLFSINLTWTLCVRTRNSAIWGRQTMACHGTDWITVVYLQAFVTRSSKVYIGYTGNTFDKRIDIQRQFYCVS